MAASNRVFETVLIDCLINASNVSLHPFALLSLARTTPRIRQALINNRAFNKWIQPTCNCNLCRGKGRRISDIGKYKQFLSQFFGLGILIEKTQTSQEGSRSDSIPLESSRSILSVSLFKSYTKNLDGHGNQLYLEMSPNLKNHDIVELAIRSPVSFQYMDNFNQMAKEQQTDQVLDILEPDDIQEFLLIDPRKFVNWTNFKSLVSLSIFFMNCKQFDVGVFPQTLELLRIIPTIRTKRVIEVDGPPHRNYHAVIAKLSGSLENHTALKHLVIIDCEYGSNFVLPARLETLVSDHTEGLDQLTCLKCFAHMVSKTTQTTFVLPANLEIYVQYLSDFVIDDEKIFVSSEVNGSKCYSLAPINDMRSFLDNVHKFRVKLEFDLTLPSSLRILSAISTFKSQQVLPNLIELHTFLIPGGQNQTINTLADAMTKTWSMPKLRTLVFTDVDEYSSAHDTKTIMLQRERQPRLTAVKANAKIVRETLDLVPVDLYHVILYLPVGLMLNQELPFVTTAQNNSIHLYKNWDDFDCDQHDLRDSIYTDWSDPEQGKYIFAEACKNLKAYITSKKYLLQQHQHILVTRCGLIDMLYASRSVDKNGQPCNKFTYSKRVRSDNDF
jgi:hypothetical protein